MSPISAIVLFLLLISACGGQSLPPYEIHLSLVTADGLKTQDPVIHNKEKIGEVVQVRPAMGQAEAVIRFEKTFRPSANARFILERTNADWPGSRVIRVIDDGTPTKLPADRIWPKATSGAPSADVSDIGRMVHAQVPVETVEDRLWVAK